MRVLVVVGLMVLGSGCGIGTAASGTSSDGDRGEQGPDYGPDSSLFPRDGLGEEEGPGTPATPAGDLRLAAGDAFTCAVDDAGGVSCWGHLIESCGEPQLVEGFADTIALTAPSGGRHVCALDGSGTVRCLGSNGDGQLGDGSDDDTDEPVEVAGLSGVTSVSAGNAFTCAVADGAVKCWGSNEAGQLGADPEALERSLDPADVAGLPAAVAVAAGGAHACALADDGSVWCWGRNERGQIARPASSTPGAPAKVDGLDGVTAIAAGDEHTCATSAAGVFCWGGNDYGQLGNGTQDDAVAPSAAKTPSSAIALTGGRDTVCALVGDAAMCWGNNDDGQVGAGSEDDAIVEPAEVSGLGSGVLSISAGRDHACARLDGDAVVCWGENGNKQLGRDGGESRTPVEVAF